MTLDPSALDRLSNTELAALRDLIDARLGAPVEGRTKFFDADRGYGFVTTRRFGDVFLHRATLDRARLPMPATGEALRLQVEQNPDRPGRWRAYAVLPPDEAAP